MTKGQEKNLRRVSDACKAIRISDGEIPPTAGSVTTLSGLSRATLYRSPYRELVADLTAECPRPSAQRATSESSRAISGAPTRDERDKALIQLLQAEVLRLTMICDRQAVQLAAAPAALRGVQVVHLTDAS